jgi:hypothetical protein
LEKLLCVVEKLWFNFRDFRKSFDRVLDFPSFSCGLISGGYRYFRPCPESTDNLIFRCQGVFIGSTDPRSVVPIVRSTDLVPKVPITRFLGASKPISVVPTLGR